LYSFEKELKAKLSQKASGVQSEEQVLLKSFKYFDLNNNGTVEDEEFAKAIEKIGIMIPTKQVSFKSSFKTRYLLSVFNPFSN
jgi:Ca2+-binding EF-hand superfamily protein